MYSVYSLSDFQANQPEALFVALFFVPFKRHAAQAWPKIMTSSPGLWTSSVIACLPPEAHVSKWVCLKIGYIPNEIAIQ